MTTFRCACCDGLFPLKPCATCGGTQWVDAPTMFDKPSYQEPCPDCAITTDTVVVCDGCHAGITAYLDEGARL